MSDDVTEKSAEPRPERPRSKRTGCLVGCAILLPIAYLLSPVPLLLIYVGLDQLGWGTIADGYANTLMVFFVPIDWLYDNHEFAREFYDWYIGLIGGFAL